MLFHVSLTRNSAREKPSNKEKNEKIIRLEPGFPVFREAVTAINRAAFGRLEWYFAFFPTV
jgi:hypothetical protein